MRSGESDAGWGRQCRDVDLKFILLFCFPCCYRLSEAPVQPGHAPRVVPAVVLCLTMCDCVYLYSVVRGLGCPFGGGLKCPRVLEGLQSSSPSEGWEEFVCLVFVCFCRYLMKLLKRREPWHEHLLCFFFVLLLEIICCSALRLVLHGLMDALGVADQSVLEGKGHL